MQAPRRLLISLEKLSAKQMGVWLPLSKESLITTNNLHPFLVTLVLMQVGAGIKLRG